MFFLWRWIYRAVVELDKELKAGQKKFKGENNRDHLN
jgi:hypothetical protein